MVTIPKFLSRVVLCKLEKMISEAAVTWLAHEVLVEFGSR